ncbi:MAG: hypothetical protein ACI9XJ_001699 [Marivirga sp.]|jgi:hypothetical protein
MVNKLKYLIFFTSLIFTAATSIAQKKVKYKNLFPLLQSLDYKNAESDLLIYLSDTKDEPNPYYYYGEIVSAKLDSTEIFPTPTAYDSLIDVAIEAYKKAISLIDDKEVRKNDEFYMAYNRRDLRTGKFGIKISDVHLDYENKVIALQKKKSSVAKLYTLKKEADGTFATLLKEVTRISDKFPDEKSFMLRTGKEQLYIFDQFNEVANTYEETVIAYKERLNGLNHPFYNVTIQKQQITSWNGFKTSDHSSNYVAIAYPDYKQYFANLHEQIKTKVIPLKQLLLATNDSLNLAIQRNSTAKDTTELLQVVLPSQLLKAISDFPATKIAFELLQFKQIKADINKLENSNLFPVLNDSNNVYQRTNRINIIYESHKKLVESILPIEKALSSMLEQDMEFYLKEYKPSIQEWLVFEKTVNEKRLEDLRMLNDSLQLKVRYVLIEKDTCWMPGFYQNNAQGGQVQYVIEADSSMFISGETSSMVFLGEVGYDMSVLRFSKIDSSRTVRNMLKLDDYFIADIIQSDSAESVHSIICFDNKTEVKWRLTYAGDDQMKAVKSEASILFIYNKEDEIYLTLNNNGEIIGG